MNLNFNNCPWCGKGSRAKEGVSVEFKENHGIKYNFDCGTEMIVYRLNHKEKYHWLTNCLRQKVTSSEKVFPLRIL